MLRVRCELMVLTTALALSLAGAGPAGAQTMSSSDRPAAAVNGAGAPSTPRCFNSASGRAFCALSAPCADLVACVQDTDCPGNQVCAVNTCCADMPSPNVCTPIVGPEWQCQASGPFTCEDEQAPYFPECALVGIPAPALAPAWIAAGLLLLAAIGAAAIRGLRRGV